MIGLIAMLLPVVMLALLLLWGLFIGLKRTRIRFICVALSFVASLCAALWVKNVESGVVMNFLSSKAADNEMLATILGEEGLCDALLHCGSAIAAPWVFLGLFVALCFVTGIICNILFFVFRLGKKNSSDVDEVDLYESGYIDLFGGYGLYGEISLFHDFGEQVFRSGGFLRILLYAAAQVLLTLFVILTPVVSTIDCIPAVMDSADEVGMIKAESSEDGAIKTDKLWEIAGELNKTPLVKAYRLLGGDALCNSMESFKVGGDEYHLHNELGVITDFISNIMKLNGRKIYEYTDAEIEILRAIDSDMHNSVFLPTVAGDLIYLVTDGWLDETGSRAVFGMAKPTFDDKDTTSMVAEPFEHILEAFHNDAHDLDKLRADFDTLEHTMEILIHSGVIGSMNEEQTNSMVELLSKGDTIDLLLAEFDLNPSFAPLKDDITKIGMRAMGSTLKIPAGATENENYEQFTGDLAAKMNDMNAQGMTPEEQKTQLTTTIRETYADQMGEDLELSDEVVGLYADVLIEEFQGKEGVTAEDMQKFFDSYSGVQSE